MPGGGAFGKRPEDMGTVELLVDGALRLGVTVIAALIFGCLAAASDIQVGLRISFGLFGLLLVSFLATSTVGCVRELRRRYRG
jgi:hypothetical protein